MADLKTAQLALIGKIQTVAETSTDLEKLAYAASGLEKLASQSFDGIVSADIYTIGIQGQQGFGVGAIEDAYLPDGWSKLSGHDDPASPNYGNVYDLHGSHMVWVPRFYFKFEGNNLFISAEPKSGYAVHRAFIDGGTTKRGFFIDKFGCGNVGGVFMSRQGIDLCSTSSAHNPIGSLMNAPANNHGGLYKAVKTRGSEYNLTTIFAYNALAMLAYAQGQSATSSANCAFIDVSPKFPKGNLANALRDVNDTGVTFTASGYDNCALTGSGSPFAKTTHNGQSCGVADLTGNMWEVASGFILKETVVGVPAPTDFLVLKESVSAAALLTDTEAYTAENYDALDLTGLVDANDGNIYFGNGVENVFDMSTDTNSAAYKRTTMGLPRNAGVSAAGTTQFGSDYLYRYLRNDMACLVGGDWTYGSYAGVLALTLYHNRTNSYHHVGGRASVLVS